MLSPPGRCLSPCVLRVSRSCPVLAFSSPETSTEKYMGLEIVDLPSRMEKLSLLKYGDSIGGI
jgi:hypothetical protein